MSNTSVWSVRLYDAEDQLLVESTITSESCFGAIADARLLRRAQLGVERYRKCEVLATKVVADRVGPVA